MSLEDSPSFAAYMYRFARGLKCAGHSAEDTYFDLWERFDKGEDISDELVTEIEACLRAGEREHITNMLQLLLKSEQVLLGIVAKDKQGETAIYLTGLDPDQKKAEKEIEQLLKE